MTRQRGCRITLQLVPPVRLRRSIYVECLAIRFISPDSPAESACSQQHVDRSWDARPSAHTRMHTLTFTGDINHSAHTHFRTHVRTQMSLRVQLRFIVLDLGDEARVIELFKAFKFDVVIHFAAVAYVAESYKDPLMYYQNVSRCVSSLLKRGTPRKRAHTRTHTLSHTLTHTRARARPSNTRHVLAGMRAGKVDRIVYSSTCATYGNPRRMPITESTVQHPMSPYGSSKLTSELMIKECVMLL